MGTKAAAVLLLMALRCIAQNGQTLPRVWVLSTGGTIAGTAATPDTLAEYKAGSLTGAELVNSVPEIRRHADVHVEQIANLRSSDLTTEHWLTLANRINKLFAQDQKLAGIVVTHGTNTLEETAYFLNLAVRDARPVVLVGSMRPATAISADGPLNLLNAVRTASSPASRGKGVLVLLNDEIHGARDVTKTNTLRVETFRSPDFGYLGYADPDAVIYYRASTRRHTAQSEFDVTGLMKLPKVEIVYSYIQPGANIIQSVLANGVDGIVFAGTGAGLLSASEMTVLKSAASRPLMVRSNRTGSGRVLANTEFDGIGMIPADTLNPQKARVLLMLALTRTRNPAEIRRMFSEY